MKFTRDMLMHSTMIAGAICLSACKRNDLTLKNEHSWTLRGAGLVEYTERPPVRGGFVGGLEQYVSLSMPGTKKTEVFVGSAGPASAIDLWASSDKKVAWIKGLSSGGDGPVYISVIDLSLGTVYGSECMWLPESRISDDERSIRDKVNKAVTIGGIKVVSDKTP